VLDDLAELVFGVAHLVHDMTHIVHPGGIRQPPYSP
jgi:hypothetical protein